MNHLVKLKISKIKCVLVSLAICLLPLSSVAQTTPSTTINNKPISIDADNQQIDLQENTITFTGNVVIIQDSLKVKANTVVITEMQSKENQIITAYGKPVHFEQIIENNAKKTITGKANQLIYHVKQNNVVLSGNAELFQQDNHIKSDKITYDVEKQTIKAQSNKGKRVKTTIIPNQVKEIER